MKHINHQIVEKANLLADEISIKINHDATLTDADIYAIGYELCDDSLVIDEAMKILDLRALEDYYANEPPPQTPASSKS